MSNPAGLIGGCGCGAVRYQLTASPFDAGYCHCETCRRCSGAPVLAFATVPLRAFVVTAGEPRRRRSSGSGERWFCGDCGTQLAMQVAHQPDTIDFTICSLDAPSVIRPLFHIFAASSPSWFQIADTFPRHGKFRPDTPGLAQRR